MITIIFAVICLVFIAYLLNDKHQYREELSLFKEINYDNNKKIEELQSKLAFAGKNYIEMKNKLTKKINEKKAKDTPTRKRSNAKKVRKSSQRNK